MTEYYKVNVTAYQNVRHFTVQKTCHELKQGSLDQKQ